MRVVDQSRRRSYRIVLFYRRGTGRGTSGESDLARAQQMPPAQARAYSQVVAVLLARSRVSIATYNLYLNNENLS